MGVEFIPLLGAVFEALRGAPVFRRVEGHVMLAADLVREVGQVLTVDGRPCLVGHGFEEFAERTCHGRAGTQGYLGAGGLVTDRVGVVRAPFWGSPRPRQPIIVQLSHRLL